MHLKVDLLVHPVTFRTEDGKLGNRRAIRTRDNATLVSSQPSVDFFDVGDDG